MMTNYAGYRFDPPPPVKEPEPAASSYLVWVLIGASLFYVWKKGGWKKAVAASLASPAEEIATGAAL